MELSLKLAIYFLIVSSELDFVLSRPILRRISNSERTGLAPISKKVRRKERQVVQPTWLSNDAFLPIDTKVRVTEQNLKEAAAIRKSIKSAVDAGTFFIDESQSTPVIPVVQTSKAPRRPQPIFSPFDFSFDFSQWNTNIFNIENQNAFTEQMGRMWQEFVDNSKKWLNFNNT